MAFQIKNSKLKIEKLKLRSQEPVVRSQNGDESPDS
jgi:hypothetical protein